MPRDDWAESEHTMDNTMGPADYAAMSNGNGFGSDWLAMIFLFALIYGFNGGGLGGFNNAIGYENLATSNEVQNGFNTQNSMANQRDILAAVNASAMQTTNAINGTFHDTIGALSDKYNELQRDIAGVAVAQQQAIANQNDCCSATRMLISETAAQQRYESAMQMAQLQQQVQAENAATRQMLAQNRYDDLLQKYNALDQRLNTQELQSSIAAATANVVRYPNGFVYNAGPSPFCGCPGSYNI